MKRIVVLLITFLFAFGMSAVTFSQESPASEMKVEQKTDGKEPASAKKPTKSEKSKKSTSTKKSKTKKSKTKKSKTKKPAQEKSAEQQK